VTQSARRAWLRDLLAVLLLGGLCLLFFWAIITPNMIDKASFPPGDFGDQFHAFAVFEARELRAGHIPLWCPYVYSGHPFQADIQAAIFYPVSLFTIFLSWLVSVGDLSFLALEWEAILHFWFAAVFTYFFARRLLRHRGAALLSAIVFAFGGYLTSYPSQQLAVLETAAWLPLVLWLLDSGMEHLGAGRTFRLRDGWPLVAAGLAWGIALLAGHPQTAMYVFYTVLLYAIFAAWNYRVAWQRALLGFVLVQVVGVGLAAVHLLPGLEYMRHSVRATIGYAEVAGGFARQDIVQLLLPGSAGVMSPLYAGILPLLLAVLAPILRRTAQVVFWSAIAVLALLLSFGGNTFFYSLFYLAVPGFGMFRSQERAAFVFSFALAILAGFGLRWLLNPLARSFKHRFSGFTSAVGYLTLGGLLLVALSYYGWLVDGWTAESPYAAGLTRSVLLTVLLALSWFLLWLRQQRRTRSTLWVILVLALVTFDLFTINWQNNLSDLKPDEHWTYSPLELVPMQDDDRPFRVHNEWRLPPNYGCVYQLEDIWGASPLRIAAYDEFLAKVPLERAWELLNVKYVITWRKTLPTDSGLLYEEPTGDETAYLHRLDYVGPRAYVVHAARVVSDTAALTLLADPAFDPFSEALLAAPLPSALDTRVVTSTATIDWIERSAGTLALDVDTPADGLLVFSEVFYPGWDATVDGTPTPIHRAQHTLRAVPLAAGRHHVEMHFRPATFVTGALVSLVTLFLAAACLLWAAFSRRAPHTPA